MLHGPGESVWDTGYCGEYALALQLVNPHLRLGAMGDKYEDGAWCPEHFFAHDDTHLYDVTGARPLAPLLADDAIGVALDFGNDGEYEENGGPQAVAEARALIEAHASS